MASIEAIYARQILDSRGNPTVEVEVALDDGTIARAAVPSGASTGAFEAVELRDGDSRYGGKGVTQAVARGPRRDRPGPARHRGQRAAARRPGADRPRRDARQVAARRQRDPRRPLAVARAAADSADLPLFRYVGGPNAHVLPVPMMNILNGGAHADTNVDIQEFMIAPIGAPTFGEALRWGAEVYHALKAVLKSAGSSTGLGDEGGFAPNLEHNRAALDLIVRGDRARPASPRAPTSRSRSTWPPRSSTTTAPTSFEGAADHRRDDRLLRRPGSTPTRSSRSRTRWPRTTGPAGRPLTDQLGDRVQIVGDDLFVTNPERLQRGIDERTANALLVKVNQIGTLTETLDAVDLAHRNGFRCMMSHRSGETEDTTIADLAVATNCGQIKTGAPARCERVAKYNQLLRIEEELDDAARYAGARRLPAVRGCGPATGLDDVRRDGAPPADAQARTAGRLTGRARGACARASICADSRCSLALPGCAEYRRPSAGDVDAPRSVVAQQQVTLSSG